MAAIGWRLQSHANPDPADGNDAAEHEERLVAVQESGDDDGAGGYNGGMADHIRVIKHEAVPKCGSYEVRFPDGTESRFFYWDDLPSRRVRSDIFTREQALELAKAARAERDKET